MGQALRKIQVVDEGSFELPQEASKDLPKDPQRTLGEWLSSEEVSGLAGVAVRVARRALSKRHWHGAELVVREEQTGRGRGGKTLLVHVDSLPADLRGAWYAQHGIALHEQVDPETGEVRHVPDENLRHDAGFEKKYRLALWRRDLIAPLLAEARYSAGRGRVLKELAAKVHHFPDGRRKKVTGQTLYNWANAYEEEGLYGLMRKRRTDLGARRVLVTRAWDKFFAEHVEEVRRQAVADEVTQYIRGLWRAGERGWRAVAEKTTTRLIELSRGLDVVAFEALEPGRLGDTARVRSQFGVCSINRRKVEAERAHRLAAIKAKDNAVFQDRYMPSILRDYSDLVPRQIVVGDVHPVDIITRRADGSTVHPKAISRS